MQTVISRSLASSAAAECAPHPAFGHPPQAGRGATLSPQAVPRRGEGKSAPHPAFGHPLPARGARENSSLTRRSPSSILLPFEGAPANRETRAENRERGVKETQEMLPLSARLSHEENMSPKSGNPNRPFTCAKDFRLRRGPGQHAQKTHAVYTGMYSRQESSKSRAPPKPHAAALSIERSDGWPGAPSGPPKRLLPSPGTQPRNPSDRVPCGPG